MILGNQMPPVTKNLLIINAIVFIATSLNKPFMVYSFALFYPTAANFHWWQFFTYMFMHGGFFHIFFNMYALYLFGGVLEQIIGSKKFVVYYLLCGLGAAALHYGVNSLEIQSLLSSGAADAMMKIARIKMTPTLGASGAVYGILIGYAMLFPESRLTLIFPPVTLSAKGMVILFAGIEILTGVLGTSDGIAHFAHLGGMLVGFLMIFAWRKTNRLFDREKWI